MAAEPGLKPSFGEGLFSGLKPAANPEEASPEEANPVEGGEERA